MKPSLICVSSPPETSHLTLYLPVPKGSKVNDHVYCIHIQLLLILPVYFVKYLVYIPSFWMLSAPEYKKKNYYLSNHNYTNYIPAPLSRSSNSRAGRGSPDSWGLSMYALTFAPITGMFPCFTSAMAESLS